jgi:ADP-ribose pyrophosphatase YjhB (NUDIX family)
MNPWKTTASRTVYENAWIRVREDQVIRPDGKPGIYGVVHFRNKAVGVLPVESNGDVWLVGQHRYPLDQYSWEIPEGGCPEGEDLEVCARRELEEETGLHGEALEVIASVHLSNSVSDEWGLVYRATGLRQGESKPDGTEQIHVRRVPFAEAEAMLARGEITDSLSVIALLHESRRRRTGEGRGPGSYRLRVVPGRLAIARLDPTAPLPAWANGGPLLSVVRTVDELTVVADEAAVPPDHEAGRGWLALKVEGPFALSETGVLSALTTPLAAASIPLFAVSTFETDYLLVRETDLDAARHALSIAGHLLDP